MKTLVMLDEQGGKHLVAKFLHHHIARLLSEMPIQNVYENSMNGVVI